MKDEAISQNRGLFSGLDVQGRVLGALFMREIVTRFGRHNIGFLWLFVEPMMFTLGVTALWYFANANHGSNLPIVAFALTGYSSVLLWRNMPARCVSAIEPNQSLLYHRQVKLIDVYAARILLEGAGATMSFTVLSIVYLSLDLIAVPEDVLKVILAWLLLTWFGGALALCIGTMAFFSETVEKLWHPMSYIIFPLSGSAFLVEVLPPRAQEFVLILPMVHGIELLREGYFGSKVHSIYDIGYMVNVTLGMTFVGLLLLRIVSKRVVPG
ncbi:ABC transporter permease [Sphingobium algorifonticola]|uniref:ABC transporter permease n=2 Tax=Sphingobium algorifonticola TaxID=2008318 RepID=A0A437J763_9SPHN|nr:ABC transporter permease [Sphingobium algorifonticola]RVT41029.1 ABC transporter permease [Sphingobium algorifonticola]